jgi:hypothetical protein
VHGQSFDVSLNGLCKLIGWTGLAERKADHVGPMKNPPRFLGRAQFVICISDGI